MPLRLEIKRKLSARSERVKCCDFHPTEPWVLAALYSGHVFIWNSSTQTLVKSLEVCDLPVRCARFIPRKQWIICGSDDMQIRVFNYNTMEKVKTFEAHTDYIRSLAIHPTLPLVLSSSDDMFIKLWDWEKGWECTTLFEGHTHYVMQVEFNPKDSNTFASASLDRTVKVWGLNASTPHFSLEGHERGVNCVGYFRGGDRPYLVSGADDHLVKIWDYQTKTCVATLDGHTNNVSAVCFHPELPIIISGSEDGTVRLWHATTYRLENTLNYGMERVWSISCLKGSNKVALGYDDGTIVIKLGHEEPVVSMERNGRILWAKNHDIVIGNLKATDKESKEANGDGDRLPITTKDLGSCDVYPQRLMHSRDGRFVCACGDGQYIIYTALKLSNKSFGDAMEFCWASDSGVYATRESSSKIKVFKSFKQHKQFRPPFAAEGIFGGALLGVRSGEFIDFYDWAECRIVRRIDVCPRKVYWSESGDVVVLACDTSFYVLRYNRDLVSKYFDQGVEAGEQGIDKAFDLEEEVQERVRNGHFVGDCFIYTNSGNRLNYYVGGETMTLAHLASKSMYLLGYLPKENRVYLMDKSHNVYSYSLLVSVLVYQTAIVRRDFEAAARALSGIPVDHHNRIARFLEAQDLKELALEVSNDPEHKFELAMQTKKLTLARDILMEAESEQKWKQLGDAALNQEFDLKLAEECFGRSKDLGGLLLLYTSLGDSDGLSRLARMASDQGRHNIAFVCLLLLHRLEDCVNLLCTTDRIPEAAFMTRTYLPSHISRVLALWKDNLKQVNLKASESLADPAEYGEELFPDLNMGIKAEKFMATARRVLPLASAYPTIKTSIFRNLVAELKDGTLTFDEKDIPAVTPEAKSPLASAAVSPRPAATNVVESKRPLPAGASTTASISTPVASSPVAATSPSTPKSPVGVTSAPLSPSPAATARPVPAAASVATVGASLPSSPQAVHVRGASVTSVASPSPVAVAATVSSPVGVGHARVPSVPASSVVQSTAISSPVSATAAPRPVVASPVAPAPAPAPVAPVVPVKQAVKSPTSSLLDDDELDGPPTGPPPTAAELDAMLHDDSWGDNF